METCSEAPALRLLRLAGEHAERLDYDYVERGGILDAASKLHLDAHIIVKSLVFDNGCGGDAVMALMHGDERVSIRKLQRLAGMHHLMPAAPETAQRLTGYKPGGICPFGMRERLPVYAQQTLFDCPRICINAGQRGVIAVISPSALRLCGAIPGDISSGTVRPAAT